MTVKPDDWIATRCARSQLRSRSLVACTVMSGLALNACLFKMEQPEMLSPSDLPRIGTVSDRYQSYNVEMLEVTGGRFWRPYSEEFYEILKQPPARSVRDSEEPGSTPSGMNPALYEYRPPIDLANPRLRKLAAALGPACVRVSGTWANATYFANTASPPETPPEGFDGVLTRDQWKGVVDFGNAVEADIVTSFAISPGTRDEAGVWTADIARRLIDYTRSIGGRIAAAEYMNEPNLAAMGGAPQGYNAADYGRDFKVFRQFADEVVPDMIVLGPGSVGEATEGWAVASGYGTALIDTRDMLAKTLPATADAFSYHHYGAVSQRCISVGPDKQATPEDALSEQWLGRTDVTLAHYRRLRDELAPGIAFWNTETADAACGGNPWANTFLDTFRYLDQLGRLARQEVKVVAHNTLAASDYALLDDETFAPKPNYWGALLWRRFMGPTVLDPGVPIREGLHLYAHCLRDAPGGVALLAINNSRNEKSSIQLSAAARRYTLSAVELQSGQVLLNGDPLELGLNDELPEMTGQPTSAGAVELAPATITFLAVADAENKACR